MTLVIPPGYAQVVIRYSADGDPEEMVNLFGVNYDGDVTADTCNAFMDAWCDNVLSALWAGVYHCTGVTFQVAVVAGGLVSVESTNAPFTQGTGGSYVPQNGAYLVHKSTGTPGQAGRGRVYIPGVLESAVNNVGQIDSAVIGDLNSGLNAFRLEAELIPSVADLVIFHTEGSTLDPSVITGLSADAVMATQRRRLRR